MLKALHILLLLSLVIATSASHSIAQKREDPDRIKNDISRLYAGNSVKIAVHMKNGAKRKGYINDMESEIFILADSKSGQKISIHYADVSKVMKSGLSQGQKTALIVGTVGALVTLSVIFRPKPRGGLRCLFC